MKWYSICRREFFVKNSLFRYFPFQNMLFFLLSSLMLPTYICTDANVVIQKQDKAYAECGRSLTSSCKIQNYAFGMSWLTGSDRIMIAKCVGNECDKNPNYSGQYNFTFDVELGVFNLTIVKVTTDDNWRVLVCSDGSNFDTQVVKLKGCEPMLLEDIGAGRVMATSGCVSNAIHVSFKWIKISTINGIEEEFIPTIKSNYSSICSYESDCWIDKHIQYNVIIQASQSDNGQYYLKMIAAYGNELKESSNTTYMYIIGGQADVDEDHDKCLPHLAMTIMVAVSYFLFCLAPILYCMHRINCKRTCKGDGKLDNPPERKALVEKNNLQLANSFQVDEIGHDNRSQASSDEKTDIDENKKKQEQVFENHKKILLDHH